MEKEFIPYEQALELKELGFDEPCLGWYLPEIVDKGNIPSVILGSYLTKWNKFGDRLSAPLYSQCFRWFREKYKLRSAVIPHWLTDTYMFIIEGKLSLDDNNNIIPYNTYEEAELECLKKLIEIVKNNLKP
jgi:hypothetical protein